MDSYLYTIYFIAEYTPLSTIKCRGINDHDALEVAKRKLADQNFKNVRFWTIERNLRDG